MTITTQRVVETTVIERSMDESRATEDGENEEQDEYEYEEKNIHILRTPGKGMADEMNEIMDKEIDG